MLFNIFLLQFSQTAVPSQTASQHSQHALFPVLFSRLFLKTPPQLFEHWASGGAIEKGGQEAHHPPASQELEGVQRRCKMIPAAHRSLCWLPLDCPSLNTFTLLLNDQHKNYNECSLRSMSAIILQIQKGMFPYGFSLLCTVEWDSLYYTEILISK